MQYKVGKLEEFVEIEGYEFIGENANDSLVHSDEEITFVQPSHLIPLDPNENPFNDSFLYFLMPLVFGFIALAVYIIWKAAT